MKISPPREELAAVWRELKHVCAILPFVALGIALHAALLPKEIEVHLAALARMGGGAWSEVAFIALTLPYLAACLLPAIAAEMAWQRRAAGLASAPLRLPVARGLARLGLAACCALALARLASLWLYLLTPGSWRQAAHEAGYRFSSSIIRIPPEHTAPLYLLTTLLFLCAGILLLRSRRQPQPPR